MRARFEVPMWLAAIAAVGYGIDKIWESKGETLYEGEVDGMNVKYEERRLSWPAAGGFLGNEMRVTVGDKTYTMLDFLDQDEVKWRTRAAPDTLMSELEEVGINTPNGNHNYTLFDLEKTGIEGDHARNVFELSNSLYNRVRVQIWKELREERKTELENIAATIPAI